MYVYMYICTPAQFDSIKANCKNWRDKNRGVQMYEVPTYLRVEESQIERLSMRSRRAQQQDEVKPKALKTVAEPGSEDAPAAKAKAKPKPREPRQKAEPKPKALSASGKDAISATLRNLENKIKETTDFVASLDPEANEADNLPQKRLDSLEAKRKDAVTQVEFIHSIILNDKIPLGTNITLVKKDAMEAFVALEKKLDRVMDMRNDD